VAVAEPGGLVGGQRLHHGLAEPLVAPAQQTDQAGDVGLADRADDRRQPRLDQILLAGLEIDRAPLAHHLGDEAEVRGRSGSSRAPDRRRTGRQQGGGQLAGHLRQRDDPVGLPGGRHGARHPQTTLVCSSWTKTSPPAPRITRRPARRPGPSR
jgi:hypothetical protein